MVPHQSISTEIRDLVARYNVAGDGHDIGAMMSVFAAHAIYESGIFRRVGRTAIRDHFDTAWAAERAAAPVRFRRHNITTTLVEADGPERATGIVYYLVMTDLGIDHSGYYRDEYGLTDAGWKIARRGIWMEWVHPESRFVPDVSKRQLRETGAAGPPFMGLTSL